MQVDTLFDTSVENTGGCPPPQSSDCSVLLDSVHVRKDAVSHSLSGRQVHADLSLTILNDDDRITRDQRPCMSTDGDRGQVVDGAVDGSAIGESEVDLSHDDAPCVDCY